jgi:hypothetical protein
MFQVALAERRCAQARQATAAAMERLRTMLETDNSDAQTSFESMMTNRAVDSARHKAATAVARLTQRKQELEQARAVTQARLAELNAQQKARQELVDDAMDALGSVGVFAAAVGAAAGEGLLSAIRASGVGSTTAASCNAAEEPGTRSCGG